MTGIFVRIKRGEAYANVEIDQMTDEELAEFFRDLAHPEKWAIGLAKWIRDHVKEPS